MSTTYRTTSDVPGVAALGFDQVAVVPDVVTPAQQAALVAWTDERLAEDALLRSPVDVHSRMTPYLAARDRGRSPLTRESRGTGTTEGLVWVPPSADPTVSAVPDEFWQVREEVVDRLRIRHLPDDPYKGSFLTSVGIGGDVHLHKDARLAIDGRDVPLMRVNVVVRRPRTGGMPVIAGREIDVPERGMWAFHPTELVHSATPVEGDTARLTLSFGFVVDPGPVWARPLVPAAVPPEVRDAVRAALLAEVTGERAVVLDALLGLDGATTVARTAARLGVDPAAVWSQTHRLLQVGLLRSAAPPPGGGATVHDV